MSKFLEIISLILESTESQRDNDDLFDRGAWLYGGHYPEDLTGRGYILPDGMVMLMEDDHRTVHALYSGYGETFNGEEQGIDPYDREEWYNDKNEAVDIEELEEEGEVDYEPLHIREIGTIVNIGEHTNTTHMIDFMARGAVRFHIGGDELYMSNVSRLSRPQKRLLEGTQWGTVYWTTFDKKYNVVRDRTMEYFDFIDSL